MTFDLTAGLWCRYVWRTVTSVTVAATMAFALPDGPEELVRTVSHGGHSITVALTRTSIRSTRFEVLVQQTNGTYAPLAHGGIRTYLGSVVGEPGTVVAGYLRANDVLWSRIYFDRGLTWYALGTNVLGVFGDHTGFFNIPSLPTLAPGVVGTSVFAATLGVDCDHVFYARLRSNSVAVLAGVEFSTVQIAAQYLRDTMIFPQLGRVVIRANAASQPYRNREAEQIWWDLQVYNEWRSNHADAAWTLLTLATGGAYGGGGAGFNRASCQVGVMMDGDLEPAWRHELGHLWSLADWHADSPEGKTIMNGNALSRFSGSDVASICAQRDAIRTNLIAIGRFTAVPLPPYAALDLLSVQRGRDAMVTFDVLANDFDANGDALRLVNVDPTSHLGRPVSVVRSTAPGVQDMVAYHAATGQEGSDHFFYRLADASGKEAAGLVLVDVQNPFTRYEAEHATIVGAAIVTSPANTYIDFSGSSNAMAEWSIVTPRAAEYTFRFRYAHNAGDPENNWKPLTIPLAVTVNGRTNEARLPLPTTRNREKWGFAVMPRIALCAGTNTVRIAPSRAAGLRLDCLMVHQGLDCRINFQPHTQDGQYLPNITDCCRDTGSVYGVRGYGGLSYGWSRDMTGAGTDDRPGEASSRLRETGIVVSNASWEIALPNGMYRVRLVCGSTRPGAYQHQVMIEGRTCSPTSSTPEFDEYHCEAMVRDGMLTIGLVPGSRPLRLCFIQIRTAAQE